MTILVRNPIGRSHTEHIRAQTFARLTALAAVASIVAGCSAGNGGGGSPAPPLQLRIVTSSAEGPCSAPGLTSEGPGSACDRAGTTTFKLGESLGVVTPTSARLDGQGTGETVVVEFDKADANKLGDVTGKALDKQLAILLDSKVLTAPLVKERMLAGKWTFAFGTPAEAEKVAKELGASPTP